MSIEIHQEFTCPYCGSPNALVIDPTGGRRQTFVTDCVVCCSPVVVSITLDGIEAVTVDVRAENA